MFERFTEGARRVIVLAQEEARLLRHESIGTEHLLLGLLDEGEGVAATVLTSLGVERNVVRRQAERLRGTGASASPEWIPFAPRVKGVLELSLRQALLLGHAHIGTEHVLLALVAEGEGEAAQILTNRAGSLDTVRAAVLAELGIQPIEVPADADEPIDAPIPTDPMDLVSREDLERRIADLESTVATLQDRLARLERRLGE